METPWQDGRGRVSTPRGGLGCAVLDVASSAGGEAPCAARLRDGLGVLAADVSAPGCTCGMYNSLPRGQGWTGVCAVLPLYRLPVPVPRKGTAAVGP